MATLEIRERVRTDDPLDPQWAAVHKHGTNASLGRALAVTVEKYPGTDEWCVCAEIRSSAPGMLGCTALVFVTLDDNQQLDPR